MGFCFCVGDNGRADIFVPFKKVKHRYFACSTASSFAFTRLSIIPLVDFGFTGECVVGQLGHYELAKPFKEARMVFWLTPVISAIALAVVPATSISINFALNFPFNRHFLSCMSLTWLFLTLNYAAPMTPSR
jgi:hypothetical protein